MSRSLSAVSDPFEGSGERRRRLRLQIEGLIALTLALSACALTGFAWLRILAPLAQQFGLG